jgi:hypothetical protein
MNSLLQQDQGLRPLLFVWNGPISAERLDTWLGERGLEIPDDLVEFWRETGGGDLFESETILGPFGDKRLGDDLGKLCTGHDANGLEVVVHAYGG